jgi:spermidine/putrescine transport system ATP-binding protein
MSDGGVGAGSAPPAPLTPGKASPSFLRLEGLCKSFDGGATFAVDHLDLEIREGEFVSLLGSSGSGKTTTLRMIAGFEEPTQGGIFLEGSSLAHVPSHRRPVNTVFQDYALFPHLNVRRNIAFGLKAKGVNAREIATRVDDALEMVQLEALQERAPSKLSGGQRQRVALARALVMRPRVLLLDEPLGALDLRLRRQMQVVLKRLCHDLGITFIYVTHDQEEALAMSDRIAVMQNGRLEQFGTPEVLYEHPATLLVADFIGDNNLLDATLVACNGDQATVNFEGAQLTATAVSLAGLPAGAAVVLAVRPEHLEIHIGHSAPNTIHGRVIETIFSGAERRIVFASEQGSEIQLTTSPDLASTFQRNSEVTIGLRSNGTIYPAPTTAPIRMSGT